MLRDLVAPAPGVRTGVEVTEAREEEPTGVEEATGVEEEAAGVEETAAAEEEMEVAEMVLELESCDPLGIVPLTPRGRLTWRAWRLLASATEKTAARATTSVLVTCMLKILSASDSQCRDSESEVAASESERECGREVNSR